jgi:ATP-dependent RNA helicase DHX8/PRP22
MRPARPFSSQVKRSKEVDFTEAAVHAREQAKKKSKTPAATRASLQQVRRSLPVFEYRETLLNAARTNKNLIVVGETGSGKTTQIPQYLYESGFAKGGMIAVTQPRRVAAITVAQRVAEEMGVELGSLVGYTIRFDDVSSDETKIKYLTDGMLLREIQIDPRLSRYSVIMLDEAHERTLNTDILFALLKRLQATDRPDLRVIAMSATLDAAKFSSYFYGAPVALVPGRTHKVDISYTEEPVTDVVEACVTTAMGLHIDRPLGGDILVFMAGSDDIDAAKQVMEERARLLPAGTPGLIVYPLYSTLSPEQQLKAFEPTPPGLRKVVFATNIAETSITLAGIRFVIDTGVAKVKQFVPSTSVEWLAAHPISKAEAFQRSGRSGREAPGECFRLMTEDAFLDLATSVVPEILRCSMASAVLALKSIGVDDVLGFDFIDKPERRALKQALVDLIALGALDSEDMRITRLGRLMSEFPLEPHYAKVLISSADPSTAVDEKSDKYAEYQRRRAQADVAREKARAKGRSAPAEDEIAPDLPFEACSFEMATLLAAVSADQILTTVPYVHLHCILFRSRSLCCFLPGLPPLSPSPHDFLHSKTKVDLVHKQEAARRRFATPDGDLMMLLDILTQFGGLPENRREQWCKENFVNVRPNMLQFHA